EVLDAAPRDADLGKGDELVGDLGLAQVVEDLGGGAPTAVGGEDVAVGSALLEVLDRLQHAGGDGGGGLLTGHRLGQRVEVGAGEHRRPDTLRHGEGFGAADHRVSDRRGGLEAGAGGHAVDLSA